MGFFDIFRDFTDFYSNPRLSQNRPSCDDIKQHLSDLVSWLDSYSRSIKPTKWTTSNSNTLSRSGVFPMKSPIEIIKDRYVLKYSNVEFIIPANKKDEAISKFEHLKTEIEQTQCAILMIPSRAAIMPHIIGDAEIYRQISASLYNEWLEIAVEYEVLVSKCYYHSI